MMWIISHIILYNNIIIYFKEMTKEKIWEKSAMNDTIK